MLKCYDLYIRQHCQPRNGLVPEEPDWYFQEASLHGVDSTVGTQKLPLDPRESQGQAKVLPGRAECSASTAAWSDMPHRCGESPENSDRP